MKSLSRESGFSAPIVIDRPPLRRASERLFQQVAALGEPQQVAHPGVGGELRLVGQQLGAAQHDRVRLVREIEDPLPLGDEDVEQLAAAGCRCPHPAAARRCVFRICSSVSPASRSFRMRATSCTEIGAQRLGTSTKIVRTTPLRRLNTRSSRSDDTGTSSRRSSTSSSSAGDDRHAQLLGQHAQHLRRAPQDLFDRVPRPHELGAQGVLRLAGRRGQPHDLVDVDPVGPVGRDPAGGGVGVEQVPLVLQLAHRVADGGRGHAQPEPPGDRLAAGRLRGLDVGLHDRLEHPQLPLAQLFLRRHSVEIYGLTSRLGSASGERPGRRAGATPRR